jgi:hypothetical protein
VELGRNILFVFVGAIVYGQLLTSCVKNLSMSLKDKGASVDMQGKVQRYLNLSFICQIMFLFTATSNLTLFCMAGGFLTIILSNFVSIRMYSVLPIHCHTAYDGVVPTRMKISIKLLSLRSFTWAYHLALVGIRIRSAVSIFEVWPLTLCVPFIIITHTLVASPLGPEGPAETEKRRPGILW